MDALEQPHEVAMTIIQLRAYARAYSKVVSADAGDLDFDDPMIQLAWDNHAARMNNGRT